MNRIILIGNGFDLAHGLKTRYKDFIDDLWRGEVKRVAKKYLKEYEDDLNKIGNYKEWLRWEELNQTKHLLSQKLTLQQGKDPYPDYPDADENDIMYTKHIGRADLMIKDYKEGGQYNKIEGEVIELMAELEITSENHKLFSDTTAVIRQKSNSLQKNEVEIASIVEGDQEPSYIQRNEISGSLYISNIFLQYISEISSVQNWVDIEDAYHRFLNAISLGKSITHNEKQYKYASVKDLHKDFEEVKKALEKYLVNEIKEDKKAITELKEIVNSRFEFNDFSSKGQDAIVEEHVSGLKIIRYDEDIIEQINEEFKIYQENMLEEASEFDEFLHNYVRKAAKTNTAPFKLSPNNTLFLNFNYTDIEKLYPQKRGIRNRDKQEDDDIIHIHGELNNSNNPIIFGYGDELCDEYKALEALNDNEYLENVKSIKYLETDNYKRMLSFINSEEYQIFVFGQSCGNSDRTLLNTLFEHDNCVSIKVFYHKREDGTDDYSDVVRNISRNFGDKKSLREKVVNKEFSEPLPQIAK